MGCFSIFVWLGMSQEQKKNPFEKVSQVGQSKNLKVIASVENKYLSSQLKTINSEHKISYLEETWTNIWIFCHIYMMMMLIGEGGNLSLDYEAEAINSQNFRRTLKPLFFQKTLPSLKFELCNFFKWLFQPITFSQDSLKS